jgi:hypothetical protein
MPNRSDVPPAVGDLARTIAGPKLMRRGTLAKRFLKCNKPGCRCAESKDARHGPYHSIVRVVQGRTRSRHVPTPARLQRLADRSKPASSFASTWRPTGRPASSGRTPDSMWPRPWPWP